MAGPVTLALGPYAFTALGFGYQGVKRKLATPWATQQVVDRLEALQWLGPKSDEVTVEGVLFPHEFGGMENLDGLRGAALSGQTLMFVSLAGRIYGPHVIEGIDEDRTVHDALGAPKMLSYSLQLRRVAGSSAASAVSSLLRLF
ncbi:Oxidoreductase [Hyphomicrobiales bacterium]|nr:Oxidoreductase [Hyphomicrobiales bacterium]CAH1669078.1 Oxidoreductase [Hyphomicrobiales bacterium]